MLSTIRSASILLLILVGHCLTGVRTVFAAPVEYDDFDPAPTGVVVIARPCMLWRIVPRDDARVTRVRLSLNGVTVPAVYDVPLHSVAYMPPTALKAGAYAVVCRVTINRRFDIDRSWNFQISVAASDSTALPTIEQGRWHDEINTIRRALNLPDAVLDRRLCAAALGHSSYLARNHSLSHDQTTTTPGFTGATSSERARAFGFAGGCFEAVSQGASGLDVIQSLFDAPYHRAAFLQPGVVEVGSGAQSGIVTLLFGVSSASGVIVYPANGQTNVPVSWTGIESPNPLRIHRPDAITAPTGYPITLFAFGRDDPHLSVGRATLTTADGKPVPVFVNTPFNDQFLQNGALLFPERPLRPHMVYRVSVQVFDAAGIDRSRVWSFTTGSAPAVGGR